MKPRKFHTLVAVAGLACVGTAAYVYQRHAPSVEAGQRAAAKPSVTPAASNPERAGPVAVEVAPVQVLRLQDDAQAVGSLRARQGVMLRPEVAGRISVLGFKDGQRVRKGQLLVQLDDTLQKAQRLQAEAQASIARTNLQRNRELASQNFVSQSAVDQSAAALEVAEAQVALAQAQLQRMRIVAPFDGVAGIRLVNIGDYVKDGADLVNIDDTATMMVDLRLPESALARLKDNQAVELTLDGLPGRNFTGRVDAIDSQLDANGRSLLVRARLDNAAGVLRPGMFARARLVFAVREKAIAVPEEALVPQGGKQYLLKVVDGPGGVKLTQRLEAKIGLRVPGKAEILQGLKAGDVVVIAGQAKLMRGESLPVKVVQLSGAPASAAASSSL